jgi:hypothetical protein
MLPSLLVLALAPTAEAEDARILMLGNSYTAFNQLHDLVAVAMEGTVPAWAEVKAQALTQGGVTLAEHAARADGSSGDTPWREALVTGDDAGSWGWVVLQDQSQVPGFPQSNADWQASLGGALTLDTIIGEGGGETVFLLTWGRRDGDSYNPTRYPDYDTMQERLVEGYLAYAEACAADGSQAWIIPAGLAWQVVHQDIVDAGQDPTQGDTDFVALYDPDGSHPSLAGSHLAALSAAAALTGHSVAEVPPPDTLDSALAATLRSAADRATLTDPFGRIPYRWAHRVSDWSTPPDLEQSADGARWLGISDPIIRPAVGVDIDLGHLDLLQLGGEHDGGAEGSGRLWLLEGGALEVDTLLGCQTACTVTIDGGSLNLGGGSATGIHQRGGALVVTGPTSLSETYQLDADGVLELQVGSDTAPLLHADSTAELLGTLRVSVADGLGLDGASIPLLLASSIQLDPELQELPAGANLRLVELDGTERLELVFGADSGPDQPEDSTPADEDSGDGEGPGGCGCSSAGSPALLWLLPGLLPLLHARRRWTIRPCPRGCTQP